MKMTDSGVPHRIVGGGCVDDRSLDIPVDRGRLVDHSLCLKLFKMVDYGLKCLTTIPQGARLLPQDIRTQRIRGRPLVATVAAGDVVRFAECLRRLRGQEARLSLIYGCGLLFVCHHVAMIGQGVFTVCHC